MPKKGNKFLELRCKMLRSCCDQETLGRHAKIGDRNAISRRLNGVKPWTMEEVYSVCDVLKIPYDEIPKYFPPNGIDGTEGARIVRE